MVDPVVADVDTLFGATTRGLLIHPDCQGIIQLHWSAPILNEMTRALVETRQLGVRHDDARDHHRQHQVALLARLGVQQRREAQALHDQ